MENITFSNPITTIAIIFVTFVCIAYFIPLYNSINQNKKGIKISFFVAFWAAIMFYLSTSNAIDVLGQFRPALVLVSWIIPSFIAILKKDWFSEHKFSQKWLVGLQMFRVVGGVFILEIFTGRVPAIFAYPAGLGDLFVGISAMVGLYIYRKNNNLPNRLVKFILWIGIIDLLSALFFGVTTGNNPAQLFFSEAPSKLLDFPTSMIPLFLVPIALLFHTLSWLNLNKNK